MLSCLGPGRAVLCTARARSSKSKRRSTAGQETSAGQGSSTALREMETEEESTLHTGHDTGDGEVAVTV